MHENQYLPPLSQSILDLIGRTPMLELNNLKKHAPFQGRMLVKCEMNNPGLSKKDRIALWIIREAIRLGHLSPGQTVVEMTSGNTGTGLAIVCSALGHPFVAVMSRGNTPERAMHMKALGAEVVLVDQAPNSIPGQVTGADLQLVESVTAQIVAERHAFRANQFVNPANTLAHELTTGPEMWQQSSGTIDIFLDCPGTSGTFTGIARYLKSQNPAIKCYIVEPENAVALNPFISASAPAHSNHKIQGAGYSRKPADLELFDESLVDGYLQVSDSQVIAASRLLARTEGLLAGFSTGAHLAAALDLLNSTEAGKTISFLACDSGMKYLSTDLFELNS